MCDACFVIPLLRAPYRAHCDGSLIGLPSLLCRRTTTVKPHVTLLMNHAKDTGFAADTVKELSLVMPEDSVRTPSFVRCISIVTATLDSGHTVTHHMPEAYL
ncbi:unnamed protein product [Ixodes pacificus]